MRKFFASVLLLPILALAQQGPVKVDKEVLQRIFNKIDRKREGIIYCRQYSAALDEDPGILDWFSLLN